MKELVSALCCGQYDQKLLDEQIEQHFKNLEQSGPIVKEGDRVAIKPNLLMRRRPEEFTTTHPAFIAAIIKAVQKRGGRAVIVESPGGPYTKATLRPIYAATGMEQAASETGAELNYDTGITSVPVKDGKVCSRFEILTPLAQADVVISAAKLKTHGQMNLSGAVKNLFGSIPGLTKPEFHYRYPQKETFGEMLVDLCETVAPAISFIDGITCMEGNGPSGGQAVELGLTMAARNPHALDLYTCSVISMPVDEVPTLKAAIGRGLCPQSAANLQVVGAPEYEIAAHRVKFKMPESFSLDLTGRYLPPFLRGPVTKLFTPRPVIRKGTCIGCGKCAESCPQKTISIKDRKAVIDYDNCIKCYCCHEMCPVKSIDIKKFRLFRL